MKYTHSAKTLMGYHQKNYLPDQIRRCRAKPTLSNINQSSNKSPFRTAMNFIVKSLQWRCILTSTEVLNYACSKHPKRLFEMPH